MTYKWNRSGEVWVRVHGLYHCAPPEVCRAGPQGDLGCRMHYHFQVRMRDKKGALDSRGFLFEQVHISNLIESLPSTELSCERLTRAVHCAILVDITNENPSLQILDSSFTLSPTREAEVTHCCEHPDDAEDLLAPSFRDACLAELYPNGRAMVVSA